MRASIKIDSVVIDYFNIVGIAFMPPEADSPLVIDPDAMLPLPISFQLLKTVSRWNSKAFQAR